MLSANRAYVLHRNAVKSAAKTRKPSLEVAPTTSAQRTTQTTDKMTLLLYTGETADNKGGITACL